MPLFSLFVVFVLVCLLSGGLLRYALARSLLDRPNTRSSHVLPTPRGGGLAIVLGFLLAVPWLYWLAGLDGHFVAALLGAGSFVAVLGFLDDHRPIAARWRLFGHFLAAAWVLGWVGRLPVLEFAESSAVLGAGGYVLASLYMVWLLNLYNFMDGIDGIASAEALCVCAGGALLAWGVGDGAGFWLAVLLGVAVSGFLPWNFPLARIFMGDVGSGFLGLVLGVLSLQAALFEPRLLWSWLILLGVFIVDASWTLLRRLLRGEPVHQAHCSHAYQRAARQAGRHWPVTLGVVGVNLCWLLPIALWVGLWGGNGPLGLVLAYLPLWLMALKLGAGTEQA